MFGISNNHLLETQTRTSTAPEAHSPRMPEPAIRWNPNFAAAQSKWPLRPSGRRGAEQGATDFGEEPNQSRIGCSFLSINPHSPKGDVREPAGIQNPDITAPEAHSPRMPEPAIRWNPNFAATQSKWHARSLSAEIRPTAEQGATDFEAGPNQSSIGCLLLSINPTLLKEMSGNTMECQLCSCPEQMSAEADWPGHTRTEGN